MASADPGLGGAIGAATDAVAGVTSSAPSTPAAPEPATSSQPADPAPAPAATQPVQNVVQTATNAVAPVTQTVDQAVEDVTGQATVSQPVAQSAVPAQPVAPAPSASETSPVSEIPPTTDTPPAPVSQVESIATQTASDVVETVGATTNAVDNIVADESAAASNATSATVATTQATLDGATPEAGIVDQTLDQSAGSSVADAITGTVPALNETLTSVTEAGLPGAIEPVTNSVTQEILPAIQQGVQPVFEDVEAATDGAVPLIIEGVVAPATSGLDSVGQAAGPGLASVAAPVVETAGQVLVPVIQPLPIDETLQPILEAVPVSGQLLAAPTPLVPSLDAVITGAPSPAENGPAFESDVAREGSQLPQQTSPLAGAPSRPSFGPSALQTTVLTSPDVGEPAESGRIHAGISGASVRSVLSSQATRGDVAAHEPASAPVSEFATAATPGSSSSFSGTGLGLFAAILAGFAALAYAMYAARLHRHETSPRSLSFVPFTPPRLVLGF